MNMMNAKLLALLLTATLAACGGGGTRGAAVCTPGVSTMAFPNGCPGDSLGGGGGGTVRATTLTLQVVNGNTVINEVSPGQDGTLQATIKDSAGDPQRNVAVTFITSDTTGGFVPSSGTALTDDNGVARVGLPAGRQTGAFTATASATVAGAATTGRVDYAVSFPPLTLGPIIFNTFSPSPELSAGANASVSVDVLSGGALYTPRLAVSFSSPCIVAGKATMGPPVLTSGGTARTSYTDKGCGVDDEVTASVTLGDATATRTGTITVLPASVGSIKFVSAATTNIALKGTGGFGRQEFSTLRFEVFDTTGGRVPGALVDFRFADSGIAQTVGGLTLNPSFATSAADGSVTTLVTAGTIPTSVRVVATLRGSTPPLTTLSNILVVSTGVPDQKHFSLATTVGNCEGRDFDQECSVITATLGDHFGNPVPDGTAVNFSAEGGIIGASCVTGSLLEPPPPNLPGGSTPAGQTTNSAIGPGSGACSVLLRSSNPRQPSGRITVLAYALGEEDFFDSNGNNVYEPTEPFTDKRPDIYRNDDEGGVTADNPDGTWTVGEPCIGPNTALTCSTAGDAQYNGVLRNPQVPSPQTLYVSGQLVQIFSGSDAVVNFDLPPGACPATGSRDGTLRVADVNGNVMPAGTLIFISSSPEFGPRPMAIVSNVALALAEPMLIPTYNIPVSCQAGARLYVKVVTPRSVETIVSFPTS
jgi:hypothetical protein